MTPPDAPKLESRRAAEFECELTERAEVWLPGWSRDEGAPDFGLALLKVAARFSSEVAERLDQTGDKMAKGFLDWLGFEAAAARPARVPVSFKLADTALEPVAAMHPIRLQAATGDEAVTFETETDLCLVPGKIAAVIGVDPGSDRYFLPPPGLTSLEPLEQLPNQWSLKSFAAAGSKTLQLDPGLGLAAGLIVEIAGGQYALNTAKDDLVTIDRKVPVGGFAAGTAVSKVADFRPFNGAINRQEHELYIGDSDLLNLDAAATIEVAGLPALGDDVTWQYWGKDEQNHPGGAVNWQSFDLPVQQSSGSVHLTKPKGAVEPLEVGAVQTRWIRARRDSSDRLVPADGVELRVNPLRPGRTEPDALGPQADWDKLLRPEVFVNTASMPPSSFYPLGENKQMLAEAQAKFIKEAASKVDSAVSETLDREMRQLHEDVERYRQNEFGRELFEAFASTYMTSHLSEGSKVRQLQQVLETKEAEVEAAKSEASVIATKLDEAAQAIKASDRRTAVLEERMQRNKIMSDLLSNLRGDKRSVMESMLETTKTVNLKTAFDRLLPVVLNEGSIKKTAPTGKTVLSETKTQAPSITGDRHVRVDESASDEDKSIAEIMHLAGIRKLP